MEVRNVSCLNTNNYANKKIAFLGENVNKEITSDYFEKCSAKNYLKGKQY